MVHLSRNRIIMLVLIFLVIGLGYFMADLEPSSPDRLILKKAGEGGDAFPDSPRRSASTDGSDRDDRQQALAKMRSLMEVREGEVSFIRISPAMMRSLLEKPDPVFRQMAEEPGHSLDVVGRPEREWMLGKLTELVTREGTVDGAGDSTDESFEWSGAHLKVSGTTHHIGDTARIHATVGKGGTGLEIISRVPHGSTVLLRLPGPDPQGVLIVVGHGKPSI